jgi:hypothetical protein
MATTRKTSTKAAAEAPEGAASAPAEASNPVVDEVHERGGWALGYVGDRVDDADDDTYTVAGVLRAARDGGE